MQINPLSVTKFAVSAIVGSGTSKILGAIIRNNVTPEKVTDQVAIAGATFVVGAMVAEKTKEYTDRQIDEIAAWYQENVKPRLQK